MKTKKVYICHEILIENPLVDYIMNRWKLSQQIYCNFFFFGRIYIVTLIIIKSHSLTSSSVKVPQL